MIYVEADAPVTFEKCEEAEDAAVTWLEDVVIPEEAIADDIAEGLGEDYPRADNGTDEGRQLNRRVVITVQPENYEPSLEYELEEDRDGAERGGACGISCPTGSPAPGACGVEETCSVRILDPMRSVRRCALYPLAVLPLVALALTGCEADLTGEDGPLGGGSLDQSVADAQAQAPEPSGEQVSHEQMREALQEHAGGTVTDTDDWWPHLRDLNRELQTLRVQPADCKPYVTSSALPVPHGALGALAEDGDSQAVIYTFEDDADAQEYLQAEHAGMERCAEHTVIRELGETRAETVTAITELSVSSGAEDALAVRRAMDTGESPQNHLAVLLHQGAHLVLVAQPEDEDVDQDEAIVDLEASAALILSDLLGEEILAPEPEPEADEDETGSDDTSEDGSSEDNETGSGDEAEPEDGTGPEDDSDQ